jgi:alpha-methylacyl-CoA racemase
MGVLTGFRIVEIAGIGPAPFCGMLLADMGAEVILVERVGGTGNALLDANKTTITNRGKRSLASI